MASISFSLITACQAHLALKNLTASLVMPIHHRRWEQAAIEAVSSADSPGSWFPLPTSWSRSATHVLARIPSEEKSIDGSG
jgi:hypothetical protein